MFPSIFTGRIIIFFNNTKSILWVWKPSIVIILRCNTGVDKKKKQLLQLCNPSWDHIIELTGVGKKPVLLSVSSNVSKNLSVQFSRSTIQKSKRTVNSVTNWHYKVELFLWQIFVPVSFLHPCKKIICIYPLCRVLPSRIDAIHPHPMAFVLGHGKSVWSDLIPYVSTKCHEKSLRMRDTEADWTQPTAWNKVTPADPQTKHNCWCKSLSCEVM